MLALFCVYICGGDHIEDITSILNKYLNLHPTKKTYQHIKSSHKKKYYEVKEKVKTLTLKVQTSKFNVPSSMFQVQCSKFNVLRRNQALTECTDMRDAQEAQRPGGLGTHRKTPPKASTLVFPVGRGVVSEMHLRITK